MKKLKEQSKKSIITTFFGSTGVGKSSLISCLLGAELNFNKGKGGRYRN
jgi:putative ribosome biogenesis GTPase RsgA